ncbi:hypothetical protein [Caballeronia arvi]|uniref:hypothetical protein n=1 Tax=Caballeronia arvi TaxID=1777135 RepID=UPI00117F2F31|nr:hypothetical protein [Caballeronia arvi]
MLTPEGADEAEIIVRPSSRGGWQVEFRDAAGIIVKQAKSDCEAVLLACHLRPDAEIRLLPATESTDTFSVDFSARRGSSDIE